MILLYSTQKRSGLQAREKEKAWQALLAILHPRTHPRLVVPEEDDFDPDTFGRELEEPEPCEQTELWRGSSSNCITLSPPLPSPPLHRFSLPSRPTLQILPPSGNL